jgi:hypothetical protein
MLRQLCVQVNVKATSAIDVEKGHAWTAPADYNVHHKFAKKH